MKNIWMLFAAAVLFAACDDNLGDDQQGAQGGVQDSDPVIVNVSATSALDYQWQSGDNVKVVFNEETSKEFAVVPGTDATVASFSYNIEEVKDVVLNDYVYVVAPGAVEAVFEVDKFSNDAEPKLKIACDIPDIQDGVITAEENLSYAVVSSELLKGDTTVPVQLNSPFAVLDLTLPEGVKSVTFTPDMYGAALVGAINIFMGTEAVVRALSDQKKVLTVEDANGLPVDAKVLVLPGNAKPLAVKMEGVDGSMYETSVLAETTLKAGEVYPVNLASDDIFSINYSIDGGAEQVLGETLAVSPLGAALSISMVSLHEGQTEVSVDADWIEVVEEAPVRSFHGDRINLQVAENKGLSKRQATITINYGEGQPKAFTLTQGTLDMSIINDEEGKAIVWEESFGLFTGSDLTNLSKGPYTNKFTITASDDFSKGAYKLVGAFYAEHYYGNGQDHYNKGADYYADMDNDVLTVYKNDVTSYYFSNNTITLNYNRADKIFSATPISINANQSIGIVNNTYIGNYAAKVFVEQPAQEGSADIAGTWDQTVVGMSWPTPSATMTISVNGTTVTITDFVATGTQATGTLEGNTITIPAGTSIGTGMSSAGSLDAAVTLTISADGKSISAPEFSIGGYMTISSYSATKQ